MGKGLGRIKTGVKGGEKGGGLSVGKGGGFRAGKRGRINGWEGWGQMGKGYGWE